MKGRSKKATGGTNEAAEDLSTKNMEYTADSNVNREAKQRKRGGKTVGKAMGMDAKKNAGRKPRKSGGRTGGNPFAFAAHAGTPAPGRKVEMNMD